MSTALLHAAPLSARGSLLAISALCSLVVGCHEMVTLTGQVTVPVDVQRLFSREQPGSVEVMGSKAGGNSGLRYLCEPTDQPLVLPYRIREYGCAEEQLVEAAAFRVKAEFLDRVRCGEVGAGSGGARGEELAHASAPVFAGRKGCDSGDAHADLTLVIK